MNVRHVLAVLRFESVRSITPGRLLACALLMFFAPVLFAMIRNTANALSPAWWSVLLFFIIPEVTCLLGLLLWASPILSSELEGKTWLYLAVRPGGKAANLWGKYISAVIWTAMSAFVSLLFSLSLVDSDDIFRLLLTMSALVVLSCLAYGALFTLLGVVFQKRAMVVAVAYTILFEGIVSLIPAVINQLTVHYHLRGLLIHWMAINTAELPLPKETLGNEPSWQHLCFLGGYTAVMLGVSYLFIHVNEYATADET